ncbi:hypothetical protein HFO42_22870 [Rhizobium leguminosarum]|uniref:Uncharacterized protein n=1 Tax=Rhizobium leguminosarum TaxID=384 RepID=A0AAJ1AB36_RHILE|nr:hypothetical protein [Rhizobium leguminosarum]MBY5594894.1 hypothetical protein [Rhizobium leguminosarum]MBY5630919.1 hypothetical protein [Rhizobium leguminosarum]MBY5652652.1 hypothetical protein [Rhizobium leguminosarum]
MERTGDVSTTSKIALALLLLGEIEWDAGSTRKARQNWISIEGLNLGNQAIGVRARALLRLGLAERQSDRIPAAAEFVIQANRMLEDDTNHELELDVDARLQFADLLRKTKKFEEAEELATEALQLGESRVGAAWVHNAESLRTLASIAWDRLEYEICCTFLEKARAIVAAAVSSAHPKRLIVDAELAEAHAMCGRRTRALQLVRSSIATETKLLSRLVNKTSSPLELGRLRTASGQIRLYISLMMEGKRRPHDVKLLLKLLLHQRGLASAVAKRDAVERKFSDLPELPIASSVVLTETYLEGGETKRLLIGSSGRKVLFKELGAAVRLEKAGAIMLRARKPTRHLISLSFTTIWLSRAMVRRILFGSRMPDWPICRSRLFRRMTACHFSIGQRLCSPVALFCSKPHCLIQCH